jgi:hypothetical protein
MPLEDFIIAVLCCVEEMWHESPAPSRLRRRGFPPKLSDSEVLTMEIVGEFLGYDTDQHIWKYFRWLFAIIWARSKSFHNRLISVFSGCVRFAAQRRGVESA